MNTSNNRNLFHSTVGPRLTLFASLSPGTLSTFLLLWALFICCDAHAQRAATAVATLSGNRTVAYITVTDGGAGYTTAPAVTFIGGGTGSGASATAVVSGGAVVQINVVAAGGGYTATPSVVVDPPSPSIQSASLSISIVPLIIMGGTTGRVMAVQYANLLSNTNLWYALTNITLSNSVYGWVDASAPPGARMYRVTLAPLSPATNASRWVWVPPGSFLMGSPLTEHDRSTNESPQTYVSFSRGYWIERYEVTQSQYSSVMGTNPSRFYNYPNRPVEQVSWFDATNYCGRLTARERGAGRVPAGYEYRLATEAEWECAARAGSTTAFSYGEDPSYLALTNYAWILTNGAAMTHDVGTKLPSAWGIYDMAGNLWEWTRDNYGPYAGGWVVDAIGPPSGNNKVMRGGSFRFAGGDCRAATREYNPPTFASDGIGIRVVLGPQLP